jgi:hypothetical protein
MPESRNERGQNRRKRGPYFRSGGSPRGAAPSRKKTNSPTRSRRFYEQRLEILKRAEPLSLSPSLARSLEKKSSPGGAALPRQIAPTRSNPLDTHFPQRNTRGRTQPPRIVMYVSCVGTRACAPAPDPRPPTPGYQTPTNQPTDESPHRCDLIARQLISIGKKCLVSYFMRSEAMKNSSHLARPIYPLVHSGPFPCYRPLNSVATRGRRWDSQPRAPTLRSTQS